MVLLQLRFLAGKIHATPWDRHVNEGEVEWPPSPWRILRALIATGFTRLGWTTLPAEAEGLLLKLAAALPEYALPPLGAGHTRHYMPDAKGDTTLILDGFGVLDPEAPLHVRWDVALTAEETSLLRSLAGHLHYLGRAESWVDAQVCDGDGGDLVWNAVPLRSGSVPDGAQPVTVLCAEPADAYREWVEARRIAMLDGKKGREAKKAQTEFEESTPPTILDALQTDTALLGRFGWSRMPGTRRVVYAMTPEPLLRIAPARRAPRKGPVPTCVLLQLRSDTVRGTVLPRVHRGLPLAERIHAALVRHADGRDVPELSGKLGSTVRRDDGHVHVLPLSLSSRAQKQLDHVLLWAPAGFGDAALDAIASLRRTFAKGIDATLHVSIVGQGTVEDFLDELGGVALGPARTWISATPYVAPRFTHKNRDRVHEQALDELVRRQIVASAEGVKVEVLDRARYAALEFQHHVKRRHPDKQQPPHPSGHALRIEFAKPVRGPIVLGYASHFGLGRFRPADQDKTA